MFRAARASPPALLSATPAHLLRVEVARANGWLQRDSRCRARFHRAPAQLDLAPRHLVGWSRYESVESPTQGAPTPQGHPAGTRAH
jgi:hypothetical protein